MCSAPYEEFALLRQNADEYGLAWEGDPVVERRAVEVEPGRSLSVVVWGESGPDGVEMVLLHGGAQNAHTWDTVCLALGRPLMAIDLPGPGHSDWPAAPRRSPPPPAGTAGAGGGAGAPPAPARRGGSVAARPASSPGPP